MPARSTPAAAARMPGQTRHAFAGRQPTSTAADRLSDLGYRLDHLIRDVRHGPPTHRQHEANVEEAEAIATELRAVFRAPTAARTRPEFRG